MKALDIIREIRRFKRKPEKEFVLHHALENNHQEFFEGAEIAYGPQYTFSFTKVPFIEDADKLPENELGNPDDFTWDDFKNLINKIENNPNQAKQLIEDAAGIAYVHEWNEWYRCILLRNLKCGLQKKSIDEVKNRYNNAKLFEQIIEPKTVEPELKKQSIIQHWSLPPIPAKCMMAEQTIDYNELKFNKPMMVEPIPSLLRCLVTINRKENNILITDGWGQPLDDVENLKQNLMKLIPILPISIVLDGYLVEKSWTTLMTPEKLDDIYFAVIDILPLSEYSKGKSQHQLSRRHDDLVKLGPKFQQLTNGLVYTIPKLQLSGNDENLKWFIEELRFAGYKQFYLKTTDGIYVVGSHSAWIKIIFDN